MQYKRIYSILSKQIYMLNKRESTYYLNEMYLHANMLNVNLYAIICNLNEINANLHVI
jgi:hypothetical protein